jgi:hypothetical protein
VTSSGGCLLIRESPRIDPGILYAVAPCRNTSNEWWRHSHSNQLVSLCTTGTCLPWQGWCLTAERGLPAPVPPPLPPPPPPPVPQGPLQATEVYRTRVHTAGHFCCPGGRAYCNATASMQKQRCSGFYDFGSPQLLLSQNGTLLSFNQGERVSHQDDNNWIDVVLTRSFDQGRSFGPLQIVHSGNNWSTVSDYASKSHSYKWLLLTCVSLLWWRVAATAQKRVAEHRAEHRRSGHPHRRHPSPLHEEQHVPFPYQQC